MSTKHASKNKISEDAKYVGGLVKRVSNFSPTSYNEDIIERKKFQKTIYLMQAFGIKLGFDFGWYIHGPYCSHLADVGYEIAEHYPHISELSFSQPEPSKIFDDYLSYMEDVKDNAEHLEIAASLHFLWVHNKDMQRDLLIEWLQTEKDLDSEFNEIEDIWKELEDERLIET